MADEIKYKGLTITDAERVKSKNFGEKQGTFSVKIPLPFEKTQIYAAVSRALGGASLNSIQAEDYEYTRMIVSLNFVITAHPDWWEGADKCPDDDFIFELWKFYLKCEEEFQKFLKKNS